MRSKRALRVAVCVMVAVGALGAAAPAERDISLRLEGQAAVRRALAYLADQQKENGSWQDQPAITGLVVTGMIGSGLPEYGTDSEPVSRGLDYIRSFARPDGGIYDRFYASYSTSICAMALVEAGLPQDEELLANAQRFLLDAQADEDEDISPDQPQYGGWGYEPQPSGEGMRRVDMSNTQLALEAVRSLEAVAEEDAPPAGAAQGDKTRTELAYGRAIRYLERCQNRQATNDQPWAGNDGGFVYRPGESKAGPSPDGGLRSYGGMTYAGLKSMVYARLDRNDPRVQAAYDWIRRNWSVTENPGLGHQGLYYYYLTMAKALNAYGVERIVEPGGTAHDWRRELVDQLLTVQNGDGSWVNTSGRWMETVPELATAYSVLAIEQALAGWEKQHKLRILNSEL
ncbi:MAG: prenyltransferase/squalene oxidase repeat-containing protein [Candidatus Brocadiia bacterium]